MTYHRIPERLYIIMNERLKTYASGAIGLVAVAVIVGGSFAIGGALTAQQAETPRPASFVTLDDDTREDFDAPITVEDEQTAIAARKAAAAEAFRLEAERLAAEKAAAEAEAARIAAEQEAASRQAVTTPQTGGGTVSAPTAPDPVRCPSGTVAGAVDDAGNESMCQATNNGAQCVEYNAANECVQWYKP